MKERSYIYKINFVDGHYYYGKRLLKGEHPMTDGYYGTPITHKDKWKTTMFWKEVIEVYDDWIECSKEEIELIRPVLNDPMCLNENCGGYSSLEILKENGRRAGKMQPLEIKKANGCKARDEKLGMFSLSAEEKQKVSKKVGIYAVENKLGIHTQTREDRVKMGEYCRDNKIGFFAMSKEERFAKWQCTVTGFVSTMNGLSRYQNNRNIDTKNRIKIS